MRSLYAFFVTLLLLLASSCIIEPNPTPGAEAPFDTGLPTSIDAGAGASDAIQAADAGEPPADEGEAPDDAGDPDAEDPDAEDPDTEDSDAEDPDPEDAGPPPDTVVGDT